SPGTTKNKTFIITLPSQLKEVEGGLETVPVHRIPGAHPHRLHSISRSCSQHSITRILLEFSIDIQINHTLGNGKKHIVILDITGRIYWVVVIFPDPFQ